MIRNVVLHENSYIKVTSMDTNLGYDQFQFDFPDDFDWAKMHEYKIVDGELMHDPLPVQKPEPRIEDVLRTEIASLSLLASIPFIIMAQAEQIDDVTIAEHAELFAEWDEHWTGLRGTILRDEGALYRALHDVGVGQNTKPATNNGSLWQRIGNPADEWPEWVPFLGVGDAYRLGDKVTHNGKRWICTEVGGDGIWNIWEPGIFGWEEVN